MLTNDNGNKWYAISHHQARRQLWLCHYRESLAECPQELGTSIVCQRCPQALGWPEPFEAYGDGQSTLPSLCMLPPHKVLCPHNAEGVWQCSTYGVWFPHHWALVVELCQGRSCIITKAKLVTACINWVNGPFHKPNISHFKHFKHRQPHCWLQEI